MNEISKTIFQVQLSDALLLFPPQLVVEWLVREGVRRQMEAVREGFEAVFPLQQLKVFYPEELEQLFCGSSDAHPWDARQLQDCTRPDHGTQEGLTLGGSMGYPVLPTRVDLYLRH